MKGHKLKVKAEVFEPEENVVQKKKKNKTDSTISRDLSSRKINGHFKK